MMKKINCKKVKQRKRELEMQKQKSHVVHTFEPLYDSQSKILILGSFPSVKSRETEFYYGHPQNRFWKVLAHMLEKDVPKTVEEKKELLYGSHIAIWDVIHSCDIEGSSDSSIENVVANDIRDILQKSKIKYIYTNGGTAFRLYKKYILPQSGIAAVKLPSTSPANASYSLERLIQEWSTILNA